MQRFHFHVNENGHFIEDEDGQELEKEAVRREAVETAASIARDAFMSGRAHKVVIDVRQADLPVMKVSLSMFVEE
jgi:hypothetical protein